MKALHSLALLAPVLLVLAGCSQSNEGHWNIPGIGGSGHLTGRVFSPGQNKQQSKTLYAKAGQNIVIKYAVTRQAGDLSISVYTTKLTIIANRLWSVRLNADGTNEVQVPIQKSGNHEVIVSLLGFAGSYDISWKNQ